MYDIIEFIKYKIRYKNIDLKFKIESNISLAKIKSKDLKRNFFSNIYMKHY